MLLPSFLPSDLFLQIFPLLLYLMTCDQLDGMVKTELAPYVICVVVDLARESCTTSYEQPVNDDLWKQCCGWGIAAQKDPHTLPRLKSLPAGLWFPHAKTSGWRPICCLPGARFLLLCSYSMAVWPRKDRLGEREGKVLALMNFECVEDDLLEHLKDL